MFIFTENMQDTTGSESPIHNNEAVDKEEGDSGIDANSQGSCSSNDVKTKEKRKEKKKKKSSPSSNSSSKKSDHDFRDPRTSGGSNTVTPSKAHSSNELKETPERRNDKNHESGKTSRTNQNIKKGLIFEATRHPAERDDFEATGNEIYVPARNKKAHK